MVPITVLKAVQDVLKTPSTSRTDWFKFARVESEQNSDMFRIEATNGVTAISVLFSSPDYVDWGGKVWVEENDIRQGLKEGGDVTPYLIEQEPNGYYPAGLQTYLDGLMKQSISEEVDIHLSAVYWKLIATVLTSLKVSSNPVCLACSSNVGPLKVTIAGGQDAEWLEVNIYVMGVRRD